MDHGQAKDEILKMLNDVWEPTCHLMVWPDRAPEKPIDEIGLVPWAKTVFFHTRGKQASLGDPTGKRLWDRFGRLIVQVNVPSGNGATDAYPLTEIIVNAFEGKKSPGGAWFREVSVNEIGPVGDWYRLNVSLDFQYSEVK